MSVIFVFINYFWLYAAVMSHCQPLSNWLREGPAIRPHSISCNWDFFSKWNRPNEKQNPMASNRYRIEISGNFGHQTLERGGKKTFKLYIKSEQTDRQTHGGTFQLLERINPGGMLWNIKKILFCILQQSKLLHYNSLYGTSLHSTALYCPELYYTTRQWTALHFTALHCCE